jgi:imidazoleglycerol phosphate synthase glutamine amidotransferase subunit HisH
MILHLWLRSWTMDWGTFSVSSKLVHSFTVQPQDSNMIFSTSLYGNIEFCSSIQSGNVFACQFHPERSGPEGMKLYHNLAALLRTVVQGGTT